MSEATMQYDFGTGGTTVIQVLRALRVPLHRASAL